MEYGIGAGFAIFFMFFLALGVFWLVQLIHVLKGDSQDKLVWVLVMVFLGPLGSLIYYFVGRPKPSDLEALHGR